MTKGRRTDKRRRLRARRQAASSARQALREALQAYAALSLGSFDNVESFSSHVSQMILAWVKEYSSVPLVQPPSAAGKGGLSLKLERIAAGADPALERAGGSSRSIGPQQIMAEQPRFGMAERHAAGNAAPGHPVVVLYRPEIPPNTGTIARLCAAFRLRLVLIGPLGFDVTEKAFRRAGLDYWPWVDIDYFDDWVNFLQDPLSQGGRLVFVETTGSESVETFQFLPSDCLIFGSETKGLPDWLLAGAQHEDGLRKSVSEGSGDGATRCVRIPMSQPNVRSINLANSVAIVASHALRGISGSLR